MIGSEYSLQLETEHCGGEGIPIWFNRGSYPYPNGIALKEGLLSGQPTTAGTFTFDINASMGGTGHLHNASTQKRFTITVTPEAIQPESKQNHIIGSDEGLRLLAQLLGFLQLRQNQLAQANENPTAIEQQDNASSPANKQEDYPIREKNDEGGHTMGNDLNDHPNVPGYAAPEHECYIKIITSNYLPNLTVNSEKKVKLEAEHCGGESAMVVFGSVDCELPDWVFVNEDGWVTLTPTVEGTFTFIIPVAFYSADQQHFAFSEKRFTVTVEAASPIAHEQMLPTNSYEVLTESKDRIETILKGGGELKGLPARYYGRVVSLESDEEKPVGGARIIMTGWSDASSEPDGDELFAISGASGAFAIHMPAKYNLHNRVSFTVTKDTATEVFLRNPAELLASDGDLGNFILSAGSRADLSGVTSAQKSLAVAKMTDKFKVGGGEGENSFEFTDDDSPAMHFSYSLLHRLIEPEIGAITGTLYYQWQSRDNENKRWSNLKNGNYFQNVNTPSLGVSWDLEEEDYGCHLRCKVTYIEAGGAAKVVYSPIIVVSSLEDQPNLFNVGRGEPDLSLVTLLTSHVVQIERENTVICTIIASRPGFETIRSKISNPVNVMEYKDIMFGHLDKITRMRSLGMGYVLKMSQTWRPDGHALGTLLYSTVLAPGEQQRLVMRERSESYTVQDTDDSATAIGETYSSAQADNISAIFNEAVDQYDEGHSKSVVKSKGWSAGGSLSGGLSAGPVSALLGVSGGYSSSTTKTTLDTSQSHSLDTASSAAQTFQRLIKGAAERLTQAKRVGIRMATATESDMVSTRLISNHNHMHSLTMQYWEVVRKYKLETCVDDVSLVVYIPLELINFSPNEDPSISIKARIQDNPDAGESILEKRYGNLLKYHDALRAHLPVEQQPGLALLRKFSALPQWNLEKTSADEKAVTFTVTLKGSFMPYDRISARLRLKSGRFIEGFPTEAGAQEMPKEIDKRQDLYRKLEECRNETGASTYKFDILVPPGIIDDDYECVEIIHSYDSQFTYHLHQSQEAKEAYEAYKHKMLNSAEDNVKTDYDLMKAGFYKIVAEAVVDPIVVMETAQLRSCGPPIISAVNLSNNRDTDAKTEGILLASGKLKLQESLSFPLGDSQPTMRYSDLQKIETMYRHVLENGVYYSQAVWGSLSAGERALLFEKYTIEMPESKEITIDIDGNNGEGDSDGEDIEIKDMNKTRGTTIPLMNCVVNQPLGFYGNCMVLPFVYPPKLAEVLETTSADLQNALYRYHTQAFRVPTTTLTMPTTGMMGDAVLGKNNASEKIDLTRFWNWSDAPIPEADSISPNYFKTNNLLDNRSAPESALPTGNVTTMPITNSLLDSVTASNVLKSMVEKKTDFVDLTGYEQLQGISVGESQARTQLAQQNAQTTQKALETAMQQHNAMQQAEAIQSSTDKAMAIAKEWRKEAMEWEAKAVTAMKNADDAMAKMKTGELTEAEKTANKAYKEKADKYKQEADSYKNMAMKLMENAAEVEKSAITSSMAAISNLYAPAKNTASDQKEKTTASGEKGNETTPAKNTSGTR